jgi:phage gpG-like protein
MIQADVVGVPQVADRLRGVPTKLDLRLNRAMRQVMIRMQTVVKSEKLRGGNPLHTRSGRLSQSIHWDVELEAQGGITGILYAGRSAPYARVHEYGGVFNILPHARVITQAFGKPITPVSVIVKAHTATYPERSFLRSTMNESREDFLERVRRAVRDVVVGADA